MPTYEPQPFVPYSPSIQPRATLVFQPTNQSMGLMDGRAITTEIKRVVNGIPGETTMDGEFPDTYQPQFRINSINPGALVPFVALYHGAPGTSSGDDNWPGDFQPQLRLNSLPHTDPPPPPIVGFWKVNEAFLAP